ncbi:MAG: cation:proton antiporter [Gammaproteobacteria bacterium]
MIEQPLLQVLILLAGSLFVVTLLRRLGLPPILGYLVVGMALGPFAFGLVRESTTTALLAELGVTFLLFTLGLEFSLPRMLAMKREVFGLGAAQVVATTVVFACIARIAGIDWPMAVVIGGAISMSSTAIIMHQLTERAELNRTHGRLAFSMLLFQDLAFVPFLALAAALTRKGEFSLLSTLTNVALGAVAVGIVLVMGRLLLRPLFQEIARSRLRELFTLAVLFVVLSSAWVSHTAGLSLALGGFLAGMMLAETEYRHQIEIVIRPFRDILLGLFFITVGMLLDVRLLVNEFGLVFSMLLGLVVLKAATATLVSRWFTGSWFKSIRTGVVISIAGEFGIALLTLVLQGEVLPTRFGQPLLVAIALSMIVSPFIISNNKRVARFLLREHGPPGTAVQREDAATHGIAQREHVILCGFGRVGQNVARVLETHGFEYIALDLDPARIRAARQAGDPVIFGDSADEEMLIRAGLERANAVIISFADPGTSIGILRSIRALRREVPILVRTQDDSRLNELREAGATDVVPETLEASLMLVSQVLMLLNVPVAKVMRTVSDIRNSRYAVLRNVVNLDGASFVPIENAPEDAEQLRTVLLPPGAWGVGRTLDEVRSRGAEVTFNSIRRHGIVGREPGGETSLRDGDIVVIYGSPKACEHAESVLLAG